MSQSKWVRVGSVRRFDEVKPDKAQALKPLEEASKVHGAWKAMTSAELVHGSDSVLARLWRKRLLDSSADLVQAALNLVAALGIEDFWPYMKACETRNRVAYLALVCLAMSDLS